MPITLSKILSFVAVAALVSAAQFGAATSADAKRVVRHKTVKHVHVHHHKRHRNVARGVATGVAVGVATGIVINSATRTNTCSKLTYRCNRGDIGACIDHDTLCY
jgi:ABC-type transport system involved in Fe-S cluster assembly fused permease/ATPase subunit